MYNKITLDNGIRILYEYLPHIRSATFGIWVISGACHEPSELSGISHFIEHMVFKGTHTRTAADIAQEFDAMGGQVNAFTSKELTCYYAKTLDTHVLQGFDILCDMVQNSLYKKKDTDNERNVIFEEIAMYEDTPEELALEEMLANVWQGHPLGRSVLGGYDTVSKITGPIMKKYINDNYLAGNIIISISGNFDVDEFANAVNRHFGGMPKSRNIYETTDLTYHPSIVLREKDIEQNHICLCFEGIKINDTKRYAVAMFNSVFGGGMSSRLFRSVREDSGLAYTVNSFSVSHRVGGVICIYLAVNPKSEHKALKLIRNETQKLIKHGITESEFARAREQIKSGLILDFESSSSRMKFMASNEINETGITCIDELVHKVDAVTKDETECAARALLDFSKASISIIGRPKDSNHYSEILRG